MKLTIFSLLLLGLAVAYSYAVIWWKLRADWPYDFHVPDHEAAELLRRVDEDRPWYTMPKPEPVELSASGEAYREAIADACVAALEVDLHDDFQRLLDKPKAEK